MCNLFVFYKVVKFVEFGRKVRSAVVRKPQTFLKMLILSKKSYTSRNEMNPVVQ